MLLSLLHEAQPNAPTALLAYPLLRGAVLHSGLALALALALLGFLLASFSSLQNVLLRVRERYFHILVWTTCFGA